MNSRCGTNTCPRCSHLCPCLDHDEVDVGVGVIMGNHQWQCPTHGLWSDQNPPVFQDDGPDSGVPAEISVALPAIGEKMKNRKKKNQQARHDRMFSNVSDAAKKARAPRPPEELVAARQDRVHVEKGKLIAAVPLKVTKQK